MGKTAKLIQPEPSEPVDNGLPAEVQEQLSAIADQRRQLQAELELNRARVNEIKPELDRLRKNLDSAGMKETEAAVIEQLQKFAGESAKKQLDRIYQTKISDPKTEQLQGNVAKLEAALRVCESRIIQIKSVMAGLTKAEKDLSCGYRIQQIRDAVKEFGSKYAALQRAYQRLSQCITEYRLLEANLPARLLAMNINDPLMVQIWGLLGSRDLGGKMLDLINNLSGMWTIPNNQFYCEEKKTTGYRLEGHFGTERAFFNAPAQR